MKSCLNVLNITEQIIHKHLKYYLQNMEGRNHNMELPEKEFNQKYGKHLKKKKTTDQIQQTRAKYVYKRENIWG